MRTRLSSHRIFVVSAMAAAYLWMTNPSHEAYGVDLEVGNVFIKNQTSSITHNSDGLAVRGDFTVLHNLTQKNTVYLRAFTSWNPNQRNQSLSAVPVSVGLGTRFFGEKLSKRIETFLSASLNYSRASDICTPESDEVACNKNIVNLRFGGGFKTRFNSSLYLILETHFVNSPLFGHIVYTADGGTTSYYGLKLATVVNPTKNMLFGAGFSF